MSSDSAFLAAVQRVETAAFSFKVEGRPTAAELARGLAEVRYVDREGWQVTIAFSTSALPRVVEVGTPDGAAVDLSEVAEAERRRGSAALIDALVDVYQPTFPTAR